MRSKPVRKPAKQGGKNKAAQSLGRLGGLARGLALSEERRKAIANAAADARWKPWREEKARKAQAAGKKKLSGVL